MAVTHPDVRPKAARNSVPSERGAQAPRLRLSTGNKKGAVPKRYCAFDFSPIGDAEIILFFLFSHLCCCHCRHFRTLEQKAELV